MSKKIMIMSCSLDGRLIAAVQVANELGYETVAIVREEDDISTVDADSCFAVDGEKVEMLLDIAKKEKIDGVFGAWDKTVYAAAVIAKELGLPGNSSECVTRFLEKGSFRRLQKEAGVFCPAFLETDTVQGLEEKCSELRFPVIVKPDLCSSSFGQTTLYDRQDLVSAFRAAKAYSRDEAVIVEEYIEQDSLCILEADVFVYGDDILWDGIHWSFRFPEAPLRPVIASYPASLDMDQENEFKNAVRNVFSAAGATLGGFNIEGFFTKDGRFFIIEINPRPAGYYSHKEIQLFCGIDFPKLIVTTAVGDLSYYEEQKTIPRPRHNVLAYAVFSFKPGIVDHVYIDPLIRDSLVEYLEFPGGEPGAYIDDIHADNRPVGVAFFVFPSGEELVRTRDRIRDLVYVVLRD